MKKHTRFLAAILTALLAFLMVSSIAYITAEADHDCIGEHCPICQQIEACENTLKQLSFGVIVAALVAALTYTLCSTVAHVTVERPDCTLVSLKVKLSN